MLQIENVEKLAQLLEISEFELKRFVHRSESFYQQFEIAKSCGGVRLITAPSGKLKDIHRWIYKNILFSVPLEESCIGYRQGRSILTNAAAHVKKDFVFNADLLDFFPSISFARVLGVFKELGYCTQVAAALANLTTFKDTLPQGAPTSPALANIICKNLDRRIAKLCTTRNWSYTRYCDDLTISGFGEFFGGELLDEIVQSEGFKINRRKTRIARNHMRQTVTGVVVNTVPNLPREQRRRMRAAVHQMQFVPLAVEEKRQLVGKLALLHMINPENSISAEYKRLSAEMSDKD